MIRRHAALFEGLALAAGLPTVGSTSADDDATLAAQRRLAKALKLSWTTRSGAKTSQHSKTTRSRQQLASLNGPRLDDFLSRLREP